MMNTTDDVEIIKINEKHCNKCHSKYSNDKRLTKWRKHYKIPEDAFKYKLIDECNEKNDILCSRCYSNLKNLIYDEKGRESCHYCEVEYKSGNICWRGNATKSRESVGEAIKLNIFNEKKVKVKVCNNCIPHLVKQIVERKKNNGIQCCRECGFSYDEKHPKWEAPPENKSLKRKEAESFGLLEMGDRICTSCIFTVNKRVGKEEKERVKKRKMEEISSKPHLLIVNQMEEMKREHNYEILIHKICLSINSVNFSQLNNDNIEQLSIYLRELKELQKDITKVADSVLYYLSQYQLFESFLTSDGTKFLERDFKDERVNEFILKIGHSIQKKAEELGYRPCQGITDSENIDFLEKYYCKTNFITGKDFVKKGENNNGKPCYWSCHGLMVPSNKKFCHSCKHLQKNLSRKVAQKKISPNKNYVPSDTLNINYQHLFNENSVLVEKVKWFFDHIEEREIKQSENIELEKEKVEVQNKKTMRELWKC
eukprot:TRINITY_DN1982_c0_g1_i15.p1 TRINITY_DN1982_c0_g1~~TRINITY_DN1982_c0_g1_i15.p1  ORF type:complete len:483 (-),score=116.89 TRINITY_DN1982_c0_g1_i15:1350-2798(-)